ncbi:MAG: ABC transporter ATP-binding protein [Syntrophobacterales bacterium]|nr:ABC transporter ATP-binding protein [Syntrophobacterales bacterium]
MPPAIVAQGVVKSFPTGWFKPPLPVLRGVDLEVPRGGIFGILGPNAAGKTTLISILATLLLPDAGRVEVLGLDAVHQAQLLRRRINLASAGAQFLWCLTVEENLAFCGRLYGLGGRHLKRRVAELLEVFELREHRRVTFDNLSTGLKQRLALAKTLINDPELLFLDEPTSGLDPEMARHLREEIARLNRETGLTILLTTHNLREAELLCHEVAFLKDGVLAVHGSIPELQARLGLGDRVRLSFAGPPPPLDYGALPGVVAAEVTDSQVVLVVDRAEVRLAPLLCLLQQNGAPPVSVRLKEADLEDLYHELAR